MSFVGGWNYYKGVTLLDLSDTLPHQALGGTLKFFETHFFLWMDYSNPVPL